MANDSDPKCTMKMSMRGALSRTRLFQFLGQPPFVLRLPWKHELVPPSSGGRRKTPFRRVLALVGLLLGGGDAGGASAVVRDVPGASSTNQPSVSELDQAVAALRETRSKQDVPTRRRTLWRADLAARLVKQGRLAEAAPLVRETRASSWRLVAAGDLGLAFLQNTNGIRLESVCDLSQAQEFLAPKTAPLFTLTLRHARTKKELRLTAETGWKTTSLIQNGSSVLMKWARALDPELDRVAVEVKASLEGETRSVRWGLNVANENPEWSVWRVAFPEVTLADLGPAMMVLFPRGPGEVQTNICSRTFKYRGNYPGGWCSMQFMAAYRNTENPTGLYLAMHDPLGSTKDIILESDPATRSVRMAYDHPSPGMGIAGNDFVLSGVSVWRLWRGDWFDAASIYRDWARREARWWPRLARAGREDTPLWMRELSAWTMTGGAASECVSRVQQFQQFLGVPVGFHWYNWHQIPFDNDYPHYFPAKTNFTQGVRDLQASSVFVMPYINGRLWDSHDQGAKDFEFTSVALPAATKKDDGTPYLEAYGSKETNGQPVRLAAMCPSTPLWQERVNDIVARLLNEAGTRGVYVDQVAAAAPTLCFDATHGHPVGGGHWWNEGYWKMLERMRQARPHDAMLTTECNGEPFVRWFDGYLTWHWQYDGQVPAFPAVYGGAIQMFGRAYRGGATKDLALRMKAGQQLVYGEQLGWLDPGLVKEKDNAAFFRQAVQMRWKFRRYFYAGEMARPPKLIGDVPRVRADWQWSGEWWVTTDAVLTGAWHLPGEKRLVLLFANVSDQAVSANLPFDAKSYGIRAKKLRAVVTKGDGTVSETRTLPERMTEPVIFPPRQVQAWELSW